MKRIVILADGTCNSREEGGPATVLRMARGIKPHSKCAKQVVLSDWGVGSNRKKVTGGVR